MQAGLRTRALTFPFYKGLQFDPNLPRLSLFASWLVCVCLIPQARSVLARKNHVGSLTAPYFPHSVRASSPGVGGHTAGHLSRLSSRSHGPSCQRGHHSAPLGADLCFVHMWFFLGTPQSTSKGPGLRSRQPAPDTARVRGLVRTPGLRPVHPFLTPVVVTSACRSSGGKSEKRSTQSSAENILQSGHGNVRLGSSYLKPHSAATETGQVQLPLSP